MTRVTFVSLLCLSGAIACGGGNGSPTPTPASPSATPSTTTTSFTVAIAAANEVPPAASAEANVAGTATITLRTTKDGAGTVTAATVDVQVTMTGLPASSALTMAHIHRGSAGASGGIVVDTGLTTTAAGTSTFQKTSINVPADIAQGILGGPAGFYFNVHSSASPNGLARGQLSGSSQPPAGSGGGDAPPNSYLTGHASHLGR